MMICAGLMTGCANWTVSDDALAIGLRRPMNDLNAVLVTDDLPAIRRAGRAVIATYDAALSDM